MLCAFEVEKRRRRKKRAVVAGDMVGGWEWRR